MEKETGIISRKQRIIMFVWPFQGHINPMLQLANILYSKGFTITILHTHFNAPNTSNYPHFTFEPVLDKPENKSQDTRAFVRSFLFKQDRGDALRDKLLELLLLEKEEPVSCLITDALWHFSQSVADSLGILRIVLWTSSLFSVAIHHSIPRLDDRGFFKLDNTHFEDRVEEFPFLKVKDIFKMGNKGKKDPVTEFLMSPMLKQTKASSGIIWNSFKELEGPYRETLLSDFKVPSFLIPLPKHLTASSSSLLEHDRTFFDWLDKQPPNSVLYVSFGSISQLQEKDFMEIAHGLVDSKQSFLWVVRPELVDGSNRLESLPDGFLGEKGRVVNWVPQQEVLAHKAIGAFWTHNGWNSTMECICEGVAMICSPILDDQPLNARYMSDVLKVGVYLENGWQRQEIASVIRRVIVDEEGEKIRERARVLKHKLDVSIIKGGSSHESLESLVDYISSFQTDAYYGVQVCSEAKPECNIKAIQLHT